MSSASPAAPTTPRELAMVAFREILGAHSAGDRRAFERSLDRLTVMPKEATHAAAFDIAGHILEKVWRKGWQPADVARAVGRECGKSHIRLVIDMIAAQTPRYPPENIDDRWTAQLRDMRAEVSWAGDEEYVRAWGDAHWSDAVREMVQVVIAINWLPVLPTLIPPPGRGRAGAFRPGSQSSGGRGVGAAEKRMLAKIRALLAKAESSDFPDEADAFTAKAQQLMAVHSIDHALLADAAGNHDKPFGARISVDSPYAPSKAMLLHVAAEVNLCQAVWSPDFGFSTVFGFAADLEAAEMLFTSLLVQATTAMVRESARGDRAGSSRKRTFRESFLHAYASRVGERLMAVSAAAASEAAAPGSASAASGSSASGNRAAAGNARLLPVLASRAAAVRETAGKVFPELRTKSTRIDDPDGWAHGAAAAEGATLPELR